MTHDKIKLKPIDGKDNQAFFICDRDGRISDSNYGGMTTYLGIEPKRFESFKDFINPFLEGDKTKRTFFQKYADVADGKINSFGFDLYIRGIPYQAHLINLGGESEPRVGIYFLDFSEAKMEVEKAKKHYKDIFEILHDGKSMVIGLGLTKSIKKHIEAGNKDRAIRNLKSFEQSRSFIELAFKTYMDIAKVEGGSPITMDYVKFNEEIIEPTLAINQPKIVQRKASINRIESIKWGDTLIYCDGDRIKSVFFNLVNNALDHSEKGTTISWGHKDIYEDNKTVGTSIYLKNLRSHIPPEEQEIVFKQFYSKTDKPGEGTGLGLNLVWNTIVNEHHGDIRIESDLHNDPDETFTKIIIDLYNDDYLKERGLLEE